MPVAARVVRGWAGDALGGEPLSDGVDAMSGDEQAENTPNYFGG